MKKLLMSILLGLTLTVGSTTLVSAQSTEGSTFESNNFKIQTFEDDLTSQTSICPTGLYLDGECATEEETKTAFAALMAIMGTVFLISLVPIVVLLIAQIKVFKKAGKAWWIVFVPIYNSWVLFQISGRPGWESLLMFVPIYNLYLMYKQSTGLAAKFAKSEVFGILLLWFFSPIGYLILGFGGASYNGENTANPTQNTPMQTVAENPGVPMEQAVSQPTFQPAAQEQITQQTQPVVNNPQAPVDQNQNISGPNPGQ